MVESETPLALLNSLRMQNCCFTERAQTTTFLYSEFALSSRYLEIVQLQLISSKLVGFGLIQLLSQFDLQISKFALGIFSGAH